VKASVERKAAFRPSRSASVKGRTYKGSFILHHHTSCLMGSH